MAKPSNVFVYGFHDRVNAEIKKTEYNQGRISKAL